MGSNYIKHSAWAENLSIVMQLGLTMAGCIFFSFFLGRYLDQWLGSSGVATLLGILFGIIGGGVVCYRQILEITEASNRHDGPKDDNTP